MNAIDQIFAPTTLSASAQPKKELGQEDFLKLLVAQLKNQDPNNPADNGEFLGQIAQFSMVSGIDDLGVSFDGVASNLFASQSMQASQMVGKDVLVETNITVRGINESVDGAIEFSDNASSARLQVVGPEGSVIRTIELGDASVGMNGFSWDGLDNDGVEAPPGSYGIVAEGMMGGALQAVPVHIFNKVDSISVDRTNTSVKLNLSNSQQIGFSQIREFR